jgi:hypothetical protein
MDSNGERVSESEEQREAQPGMRIMYERIQRKKIFDVNNRKPNDLEVLK